MNSAFWPGSHSGIHSFVSRAIDMSVIMTRTLGRDKHMLSSSTEPWGGGRGRKLGGARAKQT